MSIPIFFSATIDEQADFIELSDETSKHIIQVLRKKQGDFIQLTNGKGLLIDAEITDANKKKCVVKKVSFTITKKPEKQIIIAISLVKNTNRFEWFLEKATEIGVTNIIPLLCSRTEKQHFRKERMDGIIMSAMLQSQQTWMPVLEDPTSFEIVLKNTIDSIKYIAHCEEGEDKAVIGPNASATSTIILIGPEGDFTLDEINKAKTSGFIPVSLGNTRLRTETAGVVAASLLMNL